MFGKPEPSSLPVLGTVEAADLSQGFWRRVFAMHPLAMIAGLCLIVLTIPAYRLLDAERGNVGAVPAAIREQGAETRKFVGEWATANLMPPVNSMVGTVSGLPAMSRDLISEQATGFRRDLFPLAYAGLGIINRRTGDVLRVADATRADANRQLTGLRGEIKPVLDTYAALPAQIGKRIEPAYSVVEEEITCRKRDAFGMPTLSYSGCIHKSVVGLMGEALKVGGVFTQHFPALANAIEGISGSLSGILADVHVAADKYLLPHPAIGFWAKVKLAFRTLKDLLTAWLRGGAVGI